MNALLISGTDTEVGKTVLTLSLAAYWQSYIPTQPLAVMKLMQTGVGDRELYRRLLTLDQTPAEINPLHFQAPLAPPLAAAQEDRPIDLGKIWATLQTLAARHSGVLVEALGGLGSPLTRELTVADLARDWRLPVVLVVPVKLGAIGQAIAHVALARYTKIQLRGIVLNCAQPYTPEQIANWAPLDLIQSLTQVPVLGLLPYLSDPTNLPQLVSVATELNLEALMPWLLPGQIQPREPQKI